MKLWHVVALIAGLALIAWGIFSLVKPSGELENQKGVVTQNSPRYTADQVITIAQAKYPACYKRESTGVDSNGMFQYTDVQTPPSITVAYIGGPRAAWKVEINCPPRYNLERPNSGIISKTVYFYETDGSLQDTYYP